MDVGKWTRLVCSMNRARQRVYENMDPDTLICRILHLIVHPNRQRHGHGSAILAKLCEEMDEYHAHGVVIARWTLVDWYRRFGFQVSGRLQVPFDGLHYMVRKPAKAGGSSNPDPFPSLAGFGRLGIHMDGASQAEDFAKRLSYELMMPLDLVDVVGARFKYAGHAYQMPGEGERGELVKLVALEEDQPAEGTGDQPAETTADQPAENIGDGLVVGVAVSNEAECELVGMHIGSPGPEGTHVEQPGLTNDHTEQPKETDADAEQLELATTQVEQLELRDSHTEQSEPTNGHAEQPEQTDTHAGPEPTNGQADRPEPAEVQTEKPEPPDTGSEQPEPANTDNEQAEPSDAQTDQARPADTHREQPEPEQQPEERNQRIYRAARPAKKKKPKRRR
ncbi:hypothetical protein B0I37DRAFT_369501 [Chaetomium sp. MPI-CAGE-AT-0009]|nr:hypothetical protein B0I37DRAFT_369501 [Chaetomium sp. MPI-CAGE-AT-0009]